MNPVAGFAIYLMIWWISFFAVLPLWNRTPTEEGLETQKGNDPGAPITHNLWKKVRINSLVALAVWLIVIVFMYVIHIPLPTIPGA
jgi:predicted secreted protein